MAVVTPAQLLRSLAELGSLEQSSDKLGLGLEEARSLLRGAAVSLERASQASQRSPTSEASQASRSTTSEASQAARAPVREPREAAVKKASHTVNAGVTATGLLDAPIDHARPAAAVGALRRVRVFSDGASRGNPGPAGAGAVIESDGRVIAELGKFLGRQTNNVAEYEGLLLGLRGAHDLGAREVDVLADSELLIRQLQGRYKVKNEALQRLHAEAMAILRGFAKHSLRHIPREQNGAADVMSNRAIDERM